MTGRVVAWFSCGIPSAVAARLAIAKYGHDRVTVARIDTGSEHPDQDRFQADVEAWLDHPVTVLRAEDFADTWAVWEKRRFIVGHKGAPCTVELKRKVRYSFQQPTDLHIWGYTFDEQDRVTRFLESEPGLTIECPLIDAGMDVEACHALVERVGIEPPAMYRLGFRNNNCIGCPKGGIGYWNHIRRHFPDAFARMALLERDIGHAVLSEEIPDTAREKRPVWLDELDPDRGDILTEPSHQCSLICAGVEMDLEVPVTIGGAA